MSDKEMLNSTQAMESFKKRVLDEERLSLSNVVHYDDSQMVNKIIKIYEEVKSGNENK